jgi:hypothetical protein
MKIIRLTTTNHCEQKRAMILSLLGVGFILIWLFVALMIQECYRIFVKQMGTPSAVGQSIECMVFNNTCHCEMMPNETLFQERCLSHLKLNVTRIAPQLSLILQLFAFREYVTLCNGVPRLLYQMTWLLFPGVSIALAVAMFSTHCHHFDLGFSIFVTGYVLGVITLHDYLENTTVATNARRAARRSSSSSECTDDEVESWKSIL